MHRIQTLNKLSARGIEVFPLDEFEIASELSNPDAFIVRSASLHEMQFPASLKAIARAGAGINNIPVERCSERGIVVFNTPGANANAVKELVLAGLLMSSRRISRGVIWVRGLAGRGEEVAELVEKEKSKFAGPELSGKTLGIIGLGAIGVMVANAAVSLGMNVMGFDPFISIESAWGLSRDVKRSEGLENLLRQSDYLTIHVPLNDKTRGLVNRERLAVMKKGARILNFARGGLVNNEHILEALRSGRVSAYVTDFPEDELLAEDNVIAIPHLGASTPEAEENCAVMAAQQVKTFLETGNVKHSVNFPDCHMEQNSRTRVVIANRNIPNMVGQITTILAEEHINIADLLNRHRGELAYNIIDLDSELAPGTLDKLKRIEGVVMVRAIHRRH